MDSRRKELLDLLTRTERQIFSLFGDTYTSVLKLSEIRKAIESGADFSWSKNTAAARKVEELLTGLARQTQTGIKNGITGAWKQGESETKDFILNSFGKDKNTKEENEMLEDAVKTHRNKSMTAHRFANRKEGGFTLSSRVWNLAGNAKKELEIIIQNGILEGKSADEISQSLRQYLNEPDKLFRRVRNKETGELELSKAARNYHPGQGVYRSAYKNALRLARTEINAAYRRAEWESYQNNPLVIGYEIQLSDNHTVVINGKVRQLYDICDVLAGQYPKTFLWTGWHPQCRCRMIPVLISESDFKARAKAIAQGTLDKWKPKRTISELPRAFRDWLIDNDDRIRNAKTPPNWITDNFKDGKYTKETKVEYSDNMPEALKAGNTWLRGEEYVYSKDFFDLIDPDKLIPLTIHKKNGNDSYYSPAEGRVYLDNGGTRAERSPYYRKSLIYHEFGHGIDWQRGLRYSQELTDLRTTQIERLTKKVAILKYKTYYDGVKCEYVTKESKTRVMYAKVLSERLDRIYRKIYSMQDSTFTKRGITKYDVIEQIAAVQDTLKSLVSSVGWGHSTAYFKRRGASEAEYIAHCFENTFIGNRIFQKYLPTEYAETIEFIKSLKKP